MNTNFKNTKTICLTKKRISNPNYLVNLANELSVCYSIKNKDTLGNILDKEYAKYLNENSSIEHTLYPYCGEELKAPGSLNKVNISEINIDVVNILQDKLKMNIKHDAKVEKHIDKYSSKHNPNLFSDFLKDNIKKSENDVHKLIVSHSKFMKKFLKYIKKQSENDESIFSNIPTCEGKTFFDNLDIMMLRYNKDIDDVSLVAVDIIRWKNNNDEYYDFSHVKKNIISNNVIYIMRHCIGCHNTEGKNLSGLFKKATIPGYGKYAFCLPIIIDELKNKPITKLRNLFTEYTGKDWINNNIMTFGSSVVFRAILTNSIVQHMLKDNFDLSTMIKGKILLQKHIIFI